MSPAPRMGKTPCTSHCRSILHPGEQQGHAIVDMLFGTTSPRGRPPVTIARSAGHITWTYDFKPYGRGYYLKPGSPDNGGHDYVFDSPDPLWPFGYGLSYTTFDYSNMKIKDSTVPSTDGVVTLSFSATNTGERSGAAIPQVYWRDMQASTAPRKTSAARYQTRSL